MLETLDFPSLPASSENFHSILMKKTISEEEFQSYKDVSDGEGMTTFGDYVEYYDNGDVIGFVEAVEKMIVNERNNRLNMFKVSVSLPGLMQRFLFSRLSSLGDKDGYFVGLGAEHKHLARLLHENIVGSPSIIFHRYQERDKALIKDKYTCKKVLGYNANSLLVLFRSLMPTG